MVNNAGIAAMPGPIEMLPIDHLRLQLEVNTLGQVAVTQAFLPLLRQSRTPATIVNISSLMGRVALPLAGSYTASKFALEAITDSLRVELRPWRIRVVSIEPGTIATPIWEKTLQSSNVMQNTIPEAARHPYQPLIDFVRTNVTPNMGIAPDAVVKRVIQALTARRPRARYVVGWDAHFLILLNRLPVWLRDWLITRPFPKYGKP